MDKINKKTILSTFLAVYNFSSTIQSTNLALDLFLLPIRNNPDFKKAHDDFYIAKKAYQEKFSTHLHNAIQSYIDLENSKRQDYEKRFPCNSPLIDIEIQSFYISKYSDLSNEACKIHKYEVDHYLEQRKKIKESLIFILNTLLSSDSKTKLENILNKDDCTDSMEIQLPLSGIISFIFSSSKSKKLTKEEEILNALNKFYYSPSDEINNLINEYKNSLKSYLNSKKYLLLASKAIEQCRDRNNGLLFLKKIHAIYSIIKNKEDYKIKKDHYNKNHDLLNNDALREYLGIYDKLESYQKLLDTENILKNTLNNLIKSNKLTYSCNDLLQLIISSRRFSFLVKD